MLNSKKVANNTEQWNTTCAKSIKRNLQENICCGYRALTAKSKCSLHILYHYKIYFDTVKVYTYTQSNFPVSFTHFSQKHSPSMNKGRREGSISSLQDSVYQKVFCSVQAKGKVTKAFLSGKKIPVGELVGRSKKYLIAH